MSEYEHLPLRERPDEHLASLLDQLTADVQAQSQEAISRQMSLPRSTVARDLHDSEYEQPLFVRGVNGKAYLNKASPLRPTFLAIVTLLSERGWSLRRIATVCHTGPTTVRQWLALGYRFPSTGEP